MRESDFESEITPIDAKQARPNAQKHQTAREKIVNGSRKNAEIVEQKKR